MNLDLRTLTIILSLTNVLQVIALFVQYRLDKTHRGPGWWALGSAALALGFVSNYLRDIPTLGPIAIVANNALFISGMALIYVGILRFFDQHERRGWLMAFCAVFTLVMIYFTYLHDDLAVRRAMLSAAVATLFFLIARALFVHKPYSVTASAHFLAGVFLSTGGFFIVRALVTVTSTEEMEAFNPTLPQIATYLVTLIASTLWTLGLIILVNQRLNAENREANENLELIFNTSPDAVLITRLTDGYFVGVNEGFTALTGYTRAEVLGKSAPEINIWKNPADRQQLVTTLNETGLCENLEAVFQRKDGSQLNGLVSAKIITLQGAPHIISVTRDITERKRAEEALRKLNAELQTRNEELDAFAHTVAHDLINPLGVMLGYAELLLDNFGDLPEEDVRQALITVSRSGRKANSIIESLLLLASVRKQDVQAAPLDMAHIVDEVMLRLADSIQNSGAEISIPDRASWPVALGYAPWVEEIWVNYLSNAIKYGGPQPRIDLDAALPPPLSATAREQGQGGGFIRFSVRDYGPGLTPEQQERLFAPFERLGQARVKGHGLGLSVVRRIAEKLGGHVGVDSAPGTLRGSTFYFTLPAAPDL
jgi:PAS domain S-box-containing protein